MHTHPDNSFDAKNSVDEMCRAAIDRGLCALAITDHCEAPFIRFGADCEFGCFDEQIPKSFADASEAREKYSLRAVGDSFKKIDVVKDVVNVRRDETGVTTVNLYDFLLNENSLDL